MLICKGEFANVAKVHFEAPKNTFKMESAVQHWVNLRTCRAEVGRGLKIFTQEREALRWNAFTPEEEICRDPNNYLSNSKITGEDSTWVMWLLSNCINVEVMASVMRNKT